MDQTLKRLFEIELNHLHSHAQEFARSGEHAEKAKRIGLGGESGRTRDPFVNWLLDGSAFMAARARHAIEADFPRFTNALLSILYPHLSAPTPSMMVVQFGFENPGPAELAGRMISRNARIDLPTRVGDGPIRHIPYLTGRSLRPWPVSVVKAAYLPNEAEVANLSPQTRRAASGLKLTLRLDVDAPFSATALDAMDLYLGASPIAAQLVDALAFPDAAARPGAPRAWVVAPPARPSESAAAHPIHIEPLGYAPEVEIEGAGLQLDVLLPYDLRSYDGYRLLHEFFALPDRFNFIRLSGLRAAFAQIQSREVDLLFTFNRRRPELSGRVDAEAFKLNCAPAVNLFAEKIDNIRYDHRNFEQAAAPDHGGPMAFEIHSLISVTGKTAQNQSYRFDPFFAQGSAMPREGEGRFYHTTRRPRPLPRHTAADPGARVGEGGLYRGSEVFLSLVDAAAAPVAADLRFLKIDAFCTNRHLPFHYLRDDVALRLRDDVGADFAKRVSAPSDPRQGALDGTASEESGGAIQWDLVSHLSLNHLSLMQTEKGDPAEALRALLKLYARGGAAKTLVEALTHVSARPDVARPPRPPQPAGGARRAEPVTQVRGVHIDLGFDPEESRAPLLAAVLERFFAGYVPATSFVRTALLDSEHKERVRWPTRAGLRMEI